MKKDEKHEPNFNAPMLGVTWLTPQQCKDCIFRDKDPFTNDEGVTTDYAWGRDSCRMFEYPESKPSYVMKNKEECEYYEKE